MAVIGEELDHAHVATGIAGHVGNRRSEDRICVFGDAAATAKFKRTLLTATPGFSFRLAHNRWHRIQLRLAALRQLLRSAPGAAYQPITEI